MSNVEVKNGWEVASFYRERPLNASAAEPESLASAYQKPDNEDQHQQAADPATDSRTAPVISTTAAKKNKQNQNK